MASSPSAASRAATFVTGPDAVYVQRVPAVPSIFVAPTPARPEFTPTCSTIGSSSGSAALMSFARCSSAIAVATAARA